MPGQHRHGQHSVRIAADVWEAALGRATKEGYRGLNEVIAGLVEAYADGRVDAIPGGYRHAHAGLRPTTSPRHRILRAARDGNLYKDPDGYFVRRAERPDTDVTPEAEASVRDGHLDAPELPARGYTAEPVTLTPAGEAALPDVSRAEVDAAALDVVATVADVGPEAAAVLHKTTVTRIRTISALAEQVRADPTRLERARERQARGLLAGG